MKNRIVVATREPDRVRRLLALLAEWLELDILIKDFSADSQAEAHVIFCRLGDDPKSGFSSGTNRLILWGAKPDSTEKSPIVTSDSPYLFPALRRQQLPQSVHGVLPPTCTGDMLAKAGESPIWTALHQRGHDTEFALEALPQLQANELPFDQLQSSQWTGLLPLIAFLRKMTEDQAWASPPLRACFMFDDPNLHWPTYGYLDYAVLAHHAKQYNYHVAMATIPLDAWFVHSAVARLFRENTSVLSLLVHGNNHTRNELGRPYPDETRERLIAQSLKRIARLERVSNLSVSRVMAAPHSACTAEMAAQLLRQSFEAVCISHDLLRRSNPTIKWSPLFGLEPAEFLSDGLPAIPRFHLSKDGTIPIIIAALTGQPIIPFGHHQDVADELRLLQRMSEDINRMGTIKWCGLSEIARTNYKYRISGNTLEIRTYSRQIHVSVPPEIEQVKVYRAWEKSASSDESLEHRLGENAWSRANSDKIEIPQYNGAARTLELRWIPSRRLDYRNIPGGSVDPWAVVRRLLTETRDRCHLYSD